MGVSRCACFEVEFTALMAMACSGAGTLAELHARTGCGARCGMCVPYIEAMLRSGMTDLPVMWAEEFIRLGIAPGAVRTRERVMRLRDEPRVPAGDTTALEQAIRQRQSEGWIEAKSQVEGQHASEGPCDQSSVPAQRRAA